MPNINLKDVQEGSMGGFAAPTPGGYICRIISAELVPEKQYVLVRFDIAAGEYEGCWKDSEFPPKDFFSYKEKALPMLKHKLHVLADDNPGWDAEAAFLADDWKSFEGKTFGAVLRYRLYVSGSGENRKTLEIGDWKRKAEIAAGDFKVMPDRDTRTDEQKRLAEDTARRNAQQPSPAADLSDDDLPF